MDIHNTPEQDDITRKLIRKAGTTEPSWDFTSRIMHTILSAKTAEVYVYKPIISKNAWLGIFLSIAAFCLLLVYFPSSSNSTPTLITPYLTPFEALLEKMSTGILKISFAIPSVQGLAGAMAAGWLLYALEKIIRTKRQKAAS